MGKEEEIAAKLKQYQELAKEDKNIDVAALAMSAFADAQQQEISDRNKKRAYWVSAVLPPLGLLIAAYYLFFSGKSDRKRTALICTIITVATLLVSLLLLKMITASVPQDQLNQLQTQNPQELLKNYKDIYGIGQ